MEYDDFIKKYIPNSFDDSFIHKEKIIFLKKIKNQHNLLFYGYEGKRVLINLYLKNLYKNIKIKTSTNMINNKKFSYNYSDYHIEIDIKNLNKDEIVNIVDFIKFYSSTKSILNINKIFLIYNFNNLPYKEQYKFRKILEKISNIRFIFHVNKLSKVIEPIVSRFLLIRISKINNDELLKFIKYILKDNNSNFNNVKNLIDISKVNGILSLKHLLVNIYIKICDSSYRIKNINTKDLLSLLMSNKDPFVKIEKSKIIINKYIESHLKIIEIYNNLFYNIVENDKINNELKIIITNKTAYYESLYIHNRSIIMLDTYIAFLIKTFNIC